MDIDKVLLEAVESNPSTSTRKFARQCGVLKDTVSQHLLSMRKVKKSSSLVTYKLTPQQLAKGLEIYDYLYFMNRGGRKLFQIQIIIYII